ncbi:hypothetical protein Agub_g1492, partial [Astrephomene gubernaculifera]
MNSLRQQRLPVSTPPRCAVPTVGFRLQNKPHFTHHAGGLISHGENGFPLEKSWKATRHPQATCCKAAAAAAASATMAALPTATLTATASLPEVVIATVVAATAYAALCFIAMVLFPRKSASIFASVWPFVPLALGYFVLLVLAWSPDTLSIMMPGSLKEGLSGGFKPQFFPRLEGISTLFSRPRVTASWVLHVLTINLFAGRWCLLQGLRERLPTGHSVLLCGLLGPMGLISHYVTKALFSLVPALKSEPQVVTLKS